MRPPRGQTVTAQGIGMKRHLLQGRKGGEEVTREEAQLVVVEEKSPQGGQVAEGRKEREGNSENRKWIESTDRKSIFT